MCRGDESQRVRRSLCGQNKMYPALKECLNCQSGLEQWLGQVRFPNPLATHQLVPHMHKRQRARTPQAVFSSFQSHGRGNGEISSPLMHRNKTLPHRHKDTLLPTNGICTLYSESTDLTISPPKCFHINLELQK